MRPDSGARRLPLTSGDEQDVFTGWRRWLCWTRRAGAVKRVKRGYWRRFRRTVKAAIRREAGNDE